MKTKSLLGCISVIIFVCSSASAQQRIAKLSPPPPDSVSMPDVTTPPRLDTSDFDSYYYFYKAGVPYDVAFADLDECRIYAETAQITALVPKFVPIGDQRAPEKPPELRSGGQFGLVGDLMAAFFIASAQEDLVNAVNRECMRYKGYSRFGTSSKIWHALTEGSETQKLARLARVASGPAPVRGAIKS